MIIISVIFIIWQNIEVMKIRIEVRKLEKQEREIIRKNDTIIYGIEKMKKGDRIKHEAAERGLKGITPSDFIVLKVSEAGGNGGR